jgi:hypothetical protein
MENVGKRNTKETEEANIIRESIKKSFKSTDCFCLPIPINNGLNGMTREETLQNLDNVDFKELRPEFRNGINELCEAIKTNISPKTVSTIPLTATSFSKYIEVVVRQLNENSRVSSVDSLSLSIKYISEKASRDAVQNYELQMKQFLNQTLMPLSFDILESKSREIMESCYGSDRKCI